MYRLVMSNAPLTNPGACSTLSLSSPRIMMSDSPSTTLVTAKETGTFAVWLAPENRRNPL